MSSNRLKQVKALDRGLTIWTSAVRLPRVILVLSISLACTETINIDFPEESPQLVVYSLFHPDSVWQVSVSTTKDLNSPNTSYPVIDGATVEIYQGEQLIDELAFQGYLERAINIGIDGTRSDTVVWRRADEYRSERGVRPEVEIAYTLLVSAPGYPTIIATGRIPAAPSVTLGEVSLNRYGGGDFDDMSVDIDGVIRDRPEQNDFYMVGASFQGIIRKLQDNGEYDTLYEQVYLSAVPANIRAVRFMREFSLFSDQSFFGIDYPLQFQVELQTRIEQERQDSITLHLGTIEEPMYRYYETLEEQANYRVGIVNLTDPPQAYDNVENGLGIFAGYNTMDFTILRNDWQ